MTKYRLWMYNTIRLLLCSCTLGILGSLQPLVLQESMVMARAGIDTLNDD